MNPFMLMMMLFQVYQALHQQVTSGALNNMHGVVYIVAQQTPATADQVLISQVTL